MRFSARLSSIVATAFTLCLATQVIATGRPVARDGTLRTAEGDLLRGTSLHVSKTYSARNLTWGLDKNNLIILRDQAHLNMIRINCLDPRAVADGRPDAAFATIQEEAYYVDSIIKNANAVGMYVMLNYHSTQLINNSSSPWDWNNFWDFYAPRYKNYPHVIYELENEMYQGLPSMNANDWPTTSEVAMYKKVRRLAPDNVILGIEPLGVYRNWGPFLRDCYGPACGIDWNAGKDAWPFHGYQDAFPDTIRAIRACGIPIINTEWSYAEQRYSNGSLEGTHHPAQWYERNNISWAAWKNWGDADQAKAELDFLIPDAINKGWAWWTGTDAQVPRPVQPAITSNAMLPETIVRIVQANGRVGAKATGSGSKYRLSILPGQMEHSSR